MPTSDGTVWMKIQEYPSLSHNCLLRHYHHIRCRLSTVGHRPLTLTIFASAGSGLHPSQTPGLNQVIRPLFWWTSNAALTDPRSPFENFSTLTAIYSLCSTACALPATFTTTLFAWLCRYRGRCFNWTNVRYYSPVAKGS